jgi:hypothetical protein
MAGIPSADCVKGQHHAATDNARITELQNRINAVGARAITDPPNIPGYALSQVDRALGALGANTGFVPKAEVAPLASS